MKKLRQSFSRFCFRHRNWGIPNLMLYVCLGSALVYFITLAEVSGKAFAIPKLINMLCFDRAAILQGEVWRLITYPLAFFDDNVVLAILSLVCYYSLGRAAENVWGTFRFNLYYFTGIILIDIYCMVFPCQATATFLNLSLFLAYATMFPDATFLVSFIIPVKAWALSLFYMVILLYYVFTDVFPSNLLPFVALANYFLFFGKDVLNLIPASWRANFMRLFKKKKKYAPEQPKVIPFPKAGSYQAEVARPTADYTHRCTVCGRTDVSHPDLEFRYCSKCNGYYCYCEDHISNHAHVQ